MGLSSKGYITHQFNEALQRHAWADALMWAGKDEGMRRMVGRARERHEEELQRCKASKRTLRFEDMLPGRRCAPLTEQVDELYQTDVDNADVAMAHWCAVAERANEPAAIQQQLDDLHRIVTKATDVILDWLDKPTYEGPHFLLWYGEAPSAMKVDAHGLVIQVNMAHRASTYVSEFLERVMRAQVGGWGANKPQAPEQDDKSYRGVQHVLDGEPPDAPKQDGPSLSFGAFG